MGVSTIKKLAASGQLHITDKDTSTFKMEECEVCAIAKTTRLTFGDISVAAQEPLEIVHSDIAGPLKPDINGNIYYVTFIDDLTGLTCIGGLKTKTAMDVLGCFKNFKRITELAFNRKVQCLRTDGGGEYLGGMKPYLQLHGIVHQVTTPYTPQLNGTAERANRTLKEMCSSMLIAAKMDHKWWFHAMQYACTLINMGKQYQGRSLEEIMWKHKPGYGQLHPFGTECWIRVPKEGRLKNDLTTKKAIKGKLLHPNVTGAGYLVVIQEEGRDVTLTSRDVVFRKPEGVSEGNTTPMGTPQQHQGHLPDQQYRGRRLLNTGDASEDEKDQDQEPQKEASPPAVNGPQDQPLDYRDPLPQIEESEEEEDSDDEDPCYGGGR
jgi:hypothetical protein